MARWKTYPEKADEVDGTRLLDKLGDDITVDAVRYAHERTGALKASIHKTDLSRDSVSVVADPHHPDEPGEEGLYGYWAEVGTSDTPAQRFLERALYKRRNP